MRKYEYTKKHIYETCSIHSIGSTVYVKKNVVKNQT